MASCNDEQDEFIVIGELDVFEARLATRKLPKPKQYITSIPAVFNSSWNLKLEDGNLILLWRQKGERFSRLPLNQVKIIRQRSRFFGLFESKHNYSASVRVAELGVDDKNCYFLTEPIVYLGFLTIFKIYVEKNNCEIVKPQDLRHILYNYIHSKEDKIGTHENTSTTPTLRSRETADNFIRMFIESVSRC
jgi:hypothetical protein